MANIEERRELGSGLMFIGLALWVADLLVVFYLPAAAKTGQHASVVSVIAILALAGLALTIVGYGLRHKSEIS